MLMFAAYHKVDNLISTIDWNGQQTDGPTKIVMAPDSLKAKFEAFNWMFWEKSYRWGNAKYNGK